MPGVNIELHVTGVVQKLKEGSYYEIDESTTQKAGEFVEQIRQIEQGKMAGQKLIANDLGAVQTSPITAIEALSQVTTTSVSIENLFPEQRAENLRKLQEANQGLVRMSAGDNQQRTKRKRRRGKRGGKNLRVETSTTSIVNNNGKRNDPIWG